MFISKNKKIFYIIYIIIIAFSVFGFSQKVEASIVRVQTVAAGKNGSTVSATWPSPTTAGNLLVAIVGVRGGTGRTITPPTGGWVLAQRSNNSTTVATAIYYIANASSQSGSSTWTFDASARATITLIEYSGVATSSVLDQTAFSTGSSTTGSSGTTAITTQANEVAVSGISAADSRRTFSAQTNGFVEVSEIDSGGNANGANTVFEEKILSAAGSQGVSATISNSVAWSGAIATFKGKNPPIVTNITSPLADGSYAAGQVVPIQVTFSESVTVTGTPQITLATGTPVATAVNYSSGSPGATITFNYTVAPSNVSSDLDYVATNSLALNGGTINATSGGLAATLTLPSPGASGSLSANKNIVIATTFTLTYSAGANGSIVGTTPQSVNYGASGTEVVATPDLGYHFVAWSDAYPTATRTDTNVTGNISATAIFAIDIFTLTYSAGANGSIVGTTPQTVNYGASGTEVVATPDLGYHFVAWSDGILTPARTDTNVTADLSVSASFIDDTPPNNATSLDWTTPSPSLSESITASWVPSDSFDLYNQKIQFYSDDICSVVSGSLVDLNSADINSYDFVGQNNTTYTYKIISIDGVGNQNISDCSSVMQIQVIGPLDHFLFENIPSPQTSGEYFNIIITAKDSFNHTVNAFSGTVDFSTDAGVITPLVSNNFVDGALVQSVKVTEAGEGKTITVVNSNGAETGFSNLFTVNPGSTAKFILNDLGEMTAGTRAGYTITRQDANNNLVTSGEDVIYLSTTSLASSRFYDAAIDGEEITQTSIPEGEFTKNFWYYDDNIGNWTITVSDSDPADGDVGVSDGADSIEVIPAPIVATRFVVINPVSATAGDTVSIVVQAEDDAGNVDTSYFGGVTLHATSLSGDVSPGGIVSIANGIGSINILDVKAETATITLEDTESTEFFLPPPQDIDFLPGSLNYFIMDNIFSPQMVGSNISLVITAKDANNNTVTSFGGTVDFSTDAGVITPLVSNNFVDGALIQNVTVTQAGTGKTITATKTGDAQYITSNAFDVDAASVNNFLVEASGGGDITTQTTNVPFYIKITAKDMFGNIANGFNGAVDVSSTGILSSGGGNTALFNAGILLTHPVTISNPGSFAIMVLRVGGDEAGVSNVFNVTPVPIVATKIVILDPADTQVGESTSVTIKAVDDEGNLDSTYQGSIILVSSGSATGGGLVDIVNGVGIKTITDTVAETVNLSLGNVIPPTALDISSTQNVVFSVKPSAHHGSSSFQLIAPIISFSGRAFPEASMSIIAIKDGNVPISNISRSNKSGNFNTNFSGILPDTVNSFALVVYDKNQNITQTKIFKLNTNGQLFANILMAPTVDLKQQVVTRGAFMGISGSAMPNYQIELMLDGVNLPEETTADNSGKYSLNFNTFNLSLGEHVLRVRQLDKNNIASDYSIEKRFLVTSSFLPKADLNGDGKVDIKDWGIFMARYNSTDSNSRQGLDMNGDGKVDSQDLSLFIGALNKEL